LAKALRSGSDAVRVSWIEGIGRDAQIVLTSRARLARNCSGLRFVHKADPGELDRIVELLREWCSGSENSKGLSFVTGARVTNAFRNRLAAGFVIGHGSFLGSEAVAVSTDCSSAILINEEDHLRIQVVWGGLSVRQVTRRAEEIEESLAGAIEFARDPRFGYLTASICNCGAGLRVSAMMHLAALRIEEKIPAIAESARKLNVAIRGAFGEGSLPLGDLFQVSNGGGAVGDVSEIVGRLESVVQHLVKEEESARRKVARSDPAGLDHRCRRALSELRRRPRTRLAERDLSERLRLWSLTRLGLETRVLGGVSRRETNEILAGILADAVPGSSTFFRRTPTRCRIV
jgi:protein arginine kinase